MSNGETRWNGPASFQGGLPRAADSQYDFGFEPEEVTEPDAPLEEEFDSEALNELQNRISQLENQASSDAAEKKKLYARIEELTDLSKRSQASLNEKHKVSMLALDKDFQKQIGTIRLALLEAGGDPKILDAKLKDVTTSVELLKKMDALNEEKKNADDAALELIRELQDLKLENKKLAQEKQQALTAASAAAAAASPPPTPTGGAGRGVPLAVKTNAPAVAGARSAAPTPTGRGPAAAAKPGVPVKPVVGGKPPVRPAAGAAPARGGVDVDTYNALQVQFAQQEERLAQVEAENAMLRAPLAADNRVADLQRRLDAALLENKSVKSSLEISTSIQNKLNGSNRKAMFQKMHTAVLKLKSLKDEIKATVDKKNVFPDELVRNMTSQIEGWVEKRNKESVKMKKKYDDAVLNYNKELKLRRTLYNQLQEMKGNIRVYCRIRPLRKAEKEESKVTFFPDPSTITIKRSDKKINASFEFEKIFQDKSTQEEVFEEVRDLVGSVLDGFNVCIFAYGQTGSGKTFTMQGPKENPGIYQRTLQSLFTSAKESGEIEYKIKLTLLEIYNNTIQDLLETHEGPLKVVQGAYGAEVPDLKKVDVVNEEEVLNWLDVAGRNRSVACTNINEHSSRSHLILSVYCQGINKVTGVKHMGKLHLIDLAGSERVKNSGVSGVQFKEATAINTSLSALGNCISARANRAAHVPYRENVLTYLLQDSLEKNSKTLMFVQVSPTDENAQESVCSLQFAERVRKVELGKAEKNNAKPSVSRK